MESKDFWTKENRPATVERSEDNLLKPGDYLRPSKQHLSASIDPILKKAILNDAPIWLLSVYYRVGLDEESPLLEFHITKEDAEAASQRYPNGRVIDPFDFMRPNDRVFDADNLSIETVFSIVGRGEAPYEKIYQALEGAGVLNSQFQLSKDVLGWLGSEGIKKLEAQFGENWSAVAQLEYCVKHFHATSLATLAARVMVSDFIAPSDYDAGYAAREFEMLMSGVEQQAISVSEIRKKAGAAGGASSAARRMQCLEVLMEEIERLKPTAHLLSEDRILSQAFEAASSSHPSMPKSRKTRLDYETALRSEEPFKTRYEAVLRKKA